MKRFHLATLFVLAPLSAALAQLDHPAPGAANPPPKVLQPAAAAPVQPTEAPTAPKAPIYDEDADAKQQIAAALKSAKKENRRVLIQWGGNWCPWCYLLHDKLKEPALAKELMYEYDVVMIDAGKNNKNIEFAKAYDADLASPTKGGFPYLTVLDASGKVIANQETGSLESKTPEGTATEKPGHDGAKVLAFLKANEAKPLVAEAVLTQGRREAKESGKRVFMHIGAPWCGWCKKLDAWLARGDVSALFGKGFVEVKIDQDRMTGAKEVIAQYRKDNQGGIPWFAIIDPANGEALATSDAPKTGNVGFPAEDGEIAHFVTVLKATATKLSESDIESLKTTLEEGRKK